MAPQPPKAVLFDVNQTLFSLEPVRERMRAHGLTQSQDLEVWFAQVLRDGIAATAAERFVPFKEIGAYHLQSMLKAADVEWTSDDVTDILGAFNDAPPYEDVGPALRRLHDCGVQVAAMTNGTAEIANGLLNKAGVRHLMAAVMEVAAPEAWKPAPAAYHHAVRVLGLQPHEVMLAAVHPWDTNGAKSVGLQAAFVARSNEAYPGFYSEPDLTVDSLSKLASTIADWRQEATGGEEASRH